MKCPEIEHNLSVHYVNDRVQLGPCCISDHRPLDPRFSVDQQPFLVEIRDLNRQGTLTDVCRSCVKAEQSNGSSRRLAQQEFYRDWKGTGIRGLDIHLGNLCNLSCVICGPHDSTAWHPDAEKLGIEIVPSHRFQKRSQYDISWLADFENLEMVHFWGGEPLMSQVHLEFMNKLDQKGLLSRCRVIYNTNGTWKVSSEVLDAWRRSKLVELYFSIDDIEDRFQYQRHGARWQSVIDNIQWYQNMPIDNFMFYINTTWSMLNVYYLPELLAWHEKNFSQTRFGDPIPVIFTEAVGRCAINSLPGPALYSLEKKLKGIPELEFVLNSLVPGNEHDVIGFKKYVNDLDRIRGRNYKDAHTEWAQLIGL